MLNSSATDEIEKEHFYRAFASDAVWASFLLATLCRCHSSVNGDSMYKWVFVDKSYGNSDKADSSIFSLKNLSNAFKTHGHFVNRWFQSSMKWKLRSFATNPSRGIHWDFLEQFKSPEKNKVHSSDASRLNSRDDYFKVVLEQKWIESHKIPQNKTIDDTAFQTAARYQSIRTDPCGVLAVTERANSFLLINLFSR